MASSSSSSSQQQQQSNATATPKSTLTLELPPALPLLGVKIQKSPADGTCIVISKTTNDNDELLPSSPLEVGDVIESFNGVELKAVDGGVLAWMALISASANSIRSVVVRRRMISASESDTAAAAALNAASASASENNPVSISNSDSDSNSANENEELARDNDDDDDDDDDDNASISESVSTLSSSNSREDSQAHADEDEESPSRSMLDISALGESHHSSYISSSSSSSDAPADFYAFLNSTSNTATTATNNNNANVEGSVSVMATTTTTSASAKDIFSCFAALLPSSGLNNAYDDYVNIDDESQEEVETQQQQQQAQQSSSSQDQMSQDDDDDDDESENDNSLDQQAEEVEEQIQSQRSTSPTPPPPDQSQSQLLDDDDDNKKDKSNANVIHPPEEEEEARDSLQLQQQLQQHPGEDQEYDTTNASNIVHHPGARSSSSTSTKSSDHPKVDIDFNESSSLPSSSDAKQTHPPPPPSLNNEDSTTTNNVSSTPPVKSSDIYNILFGKGRSTNPTKNQQTSEHETDNNDDGMLSRITLRIPPGPLGVDIRKSPSDGTCVVVAKTDTNATSPSLLQDGDVIESLNGTTMVNVEGGMWAWVNLIADSAEDATRTLIVLRQDGGNSIKENDGRGPPLTNNITAEDNEKPAVGASAGTDVAMKRQRPRSDSGYDSDATLKSGNKLKDTLAIIVAAAAATSSSYTAAAAATDDVDALSTIESSKYSSASGRSSPEECQVDSAGIIPDGASIIIDNDNTDTATRNTAKEAGEAILDTASASPSSSIASLATSSSTLLMSKTYIHDESQTQSLESDDARVNNAKLDSRNTEESDYGSRTLQPTALTMLLLSTTRNTDASSSSSTSSSSYSSNSSSQMTNDELPVRATFSQSLSTSGDSSSISNSGNAQCNAAVTAAAVTAHDAAIQESTENERLDRELKAMSLAVSIPEGSSIQQEGDSPTEQQKQQQQAAALPMVPAGTTDAIAKEEEGDESLLVQDTSGQTHPTGEEHISYDSSSNTQGNVAHDATLQTRLADNEQLDQELEATRLAANVLEQGRIQQQDELEEEQGISAGTTIEAIPLSSTPPAHQLPYQRSEEKDEEGQQLTTAPSTNQAEEQGDKVTQQPITTSEPNQQRLDRQRHTYLVFILFVAVVIALAVVFGGRSGDDTPGDTSSDIGNISPGAPSLTPTTAPISDDDIIIQGVVFTTDSPSTGIFPGAPSKRPPATDSTAEPTSSAIPTFTPIDYSGDGVSDGPLNQPSGRPALRIPTMQPLGSSDIPSFKPTDSLTARVTTGPSKRPSGWQAGLGSSNIPTFKPTDSSNPLFSSGPSKRPSRQPTTRQVSPRPTRRQTAKPATRNPNRMSTRSPATISAISSPTRLPTRSPATISASPNPTERSTLRPATPNLMSSPTARQIIVGADKICATGDDCALGTCAYDSFNSDAGLVCCSSGARTGVWTSTSDGWPSSWTRYFCTGQPLQTPCGETDNICASNACVGQVCAGSKLASNEVCTVNNDCLLGTCGYESFSTDASRVCCTSGASIEIWTSSSDGWPSSWTRNFCTNQAYGTACGETDRICASNACLGQKCS